MGFFECLNAAVALEMEFVMYTYNAGGKCRYGPSCETTESTEYDWQIYRKEGNLEQCEIGIDHALNQTPSKDTLHFKLY